MYKSSINLYPTGQDDFFFSYLTDISYFHLKKKDYESCRTQSEQFKNGHLKGVVDIFSYLSLVFQLFYFLTKIIPNHGWRMLFTIVYIT